MSSSNRPTLAQKRKRLRIFAVIAALGVGALALALTVSALQDSISFFVTPADIAEGKAPAGRSFRLGGLVAADSVAELPEGGVRFVVTDNGHDQTVVYKGILPDLFREGQGVVTLGKLEGDIFVADEVLAKHDENYMPAEVKKALEERGEWREGETGGTGDTGETDKTNAPATDGPY